MILPCIIDIVPNCGSPPAILLRESYREGSKVKKRTLANLSQLTLVQAQAIRHILKGQVPSSWAEALEVTRSRHHGHVQAVLETMKRLGFERLIAAQPSHHRNLVVAMVAARILAPDSKLATTRFWRSTTLPELLEVVDAGEDELYKAMDWLLERQPGIEKKLAARHLEEEGLVLYDLSSSYFEGTCCPLAAYGYNRDGKAGKLQVNWGLLTNGRGCPVALSVFEGDTADSKTLLAQVEKVQKEFGIKELVLVGDRGMISQKQIEQLKERTGIDWITALRSGAIAKLVKQEVLQPGLFDEHNLFEFSHPDYPSERLMACRNAALAALRAHKRQALLEATIKELDKVKGMVAQGRLKGEDKIGLRVGKVINTYKVAKHVVLDITESSFAYRIDEQRVKEEAALDGLYVIRTSLPQERLSAPDTVRSYKLLSQVEQAFRSFKSIDPHRSLKSTATSKNGRKLSS